jgi:hypothetical protein
VALRDKLTAFFDFSLEIRKIIYITNIIENLNGKIRKYTKSKSSFPSDEAAVKSVFLAINEVIKNEPLPVYSSCLVVLCCFTLHIQCRWKGKIKVHQRPDPSYKNTKITKNIEYPMNVHTRIIVLGPLHYDP